MLILDSAIIIRTGVITLAMAITMGKPHIIQVIDYITAIARTMDISEK
ncbi:hypothetical protein R0J90_18240 [Micrococcus sp. SIMBA_144]